MSKQAMYHSECIQPLASSEEVDINVPEVGLCLEKSLKTKKRKSGKSHRFILVGAVKQLFEISTLL